MNGPNLWTPQWREGLSYLLYLLEKFLVFLESEKI